MSPADGPADTWSVLLVAALAVHAGFQATVTLLVYPALADAPASAWPTVHARHSRRITPLVVVVYGVTLAACVAALLDPGGTATGRVPGWPAWPTWPTWPTWPAVLATAGAFTTTAAFAAPLHGRLGRGHDPVLVRRLLLADRFRLGFAVVALAAALLAALG